MFISIKSLAQTTNFSYTGTLQTYTVPAGITQLTVTLKGASGGNATWGTATGGLGATVTGTITVTPGSIINIYVGGQSGWNGGGAAGNAAATQGGRGGDASDIRIGGTALTDRVLVAGGGGGAGGGGMTFPSTLYGAGGNGGNSNSAGSAGSGYPFPVVGGSTPSGPTIGGQGGTVGGGGVAGTGCAPASGTAGAVNGTGGNGFNLGNPTVKYPSGGGGGGGYVNGGGGGGGTAGTVNCTLNDNNAGGGGAGGSNFTGTATNTTVIDGNNTGNGSVSITVILSPPTITTFAPLTAKPGDAVTITGTNFNTTPTNNIVFCGATKATVTNATATQLTITVPTGATYAPITLLNTGTNLACASLKNFNPIYAPAKTNITTADFANKVDFSVGTGCYKSIMGDIDGDGKSDIIVANSTSNSISILRNTSTSGSIANTSFAALINVPTLGSPQSIALSDIDSDGKLDIVVSYGTSQSISIFKNNSTTGSINLATKVDFSTGTTAAYEIAIGDLDGDGKPDIVGANFSLKRLNIFRNISSAGVINSSSFATRIDSSLGNNSPQSVTLGDLDGDGKLDVVCANSVSQNTISILRNTSTVGSISLAAKVDFATGTNPRSVGIGDLDGDGKLDIVCANNSTGVNSVSVFRNTATSGSITTTSFAANVAFTAGAAPFSVTIGDIDGDGKPDLVTSNNNTNTVSILRNTTSIGGLTPSSFATKVDFTADAGPTSVAIGDIDGDGRPDLAVANYTTNSLSVLRNANIPLPIILDRFIVSIQENKALLQWSSKAEVNALEYVIERSTNGVSFEKINTVAAVGKDNEYTFTDDRLPSTVDNKPLTLYYRLRLVDKDGKYSFSEIKTLNFKPQTSNILVYPNPAKGDKLNIDFGEEVKAKTQYTITTTDGRIVQQGFINNRQETINISTLNPSIYLLKVSDKQVKKIIVQ